MQHHTAQDNNESPSAKPPQSSGQQGVLEVTKSKTSLRAEGPQKVGQSPAPQDSEGLRSQVPADGEGTRI